MDKSFYTVGKCRVKYILQILAPEEKVMITILADGTIEYGEEYTPDATAKIFWELIQFHGKNLFQKVSDLEKERDALKAQLKGGTYGD